MGPSGSGKTTILRLIARFWDATTGSVRLGGIDVCDLGSEQVIDRVAVVFQDVYLFQGSILDNVRVGRPDAIDEELRDAIRAARLQDVADRLPTDWTPRWARAVPGSPAANGSGSPSRAPS